MTPYLNNALIGEMILDINPSSHVSSRDASTDLGIHTFSAEGRSAVMSPSSERGPLPPYVQVAFDSLPAQRSKDTEILRSVLTIQAPVEYLLHEVADRSGVNVGDIGPALCRVCDAWVEVAPSANVEERKPVSFVIGMLVDLWVSHRNASLSPDERRTKPCNESTREGFVKNDPTAKVLFDSLSRLCAPSILAGGSVARNKVERSGYLTLIGQNAFKVFFDTLFIFDPEKANGSKSTNDQFIPYLWSRLESRWKETSKYRFEERAIRTVKGREGDADDIASLLEDKREESPGARLETKDEFEWTRVALEHARDEGFIRPRDYDAILECYQLDRKEDGAGERTPPSISTKMRASRGIENFKTYLVYRETAGPQTEKIDSDKGSGRFPQNLDRSQRSSVERIHSRAAHRTGQRLSRWS